MNKKFRFYYLKDGTLVQRVLIKTTVNGIRRWKVLLPNGEKRWVSYRDLARVVFPGDHI